MDAGNSDYELYDMAHQLYLHGAYDDALRLFKAIVDRNPFDVRVRGWLARTMFAMGQVEEAVRQLNIALAVKPSDVMCYLHLSTIYRKTGEVDKSIALLEAALKEMKTDFDRYWIGGLLHHARGDWHGAINALTRAYEIFPENYYVTQLLGELLVYVGEYERGRDVLQVALGMSSDLFGPYYFAAIAEAKLGNEERALELGEKASRLEPQNLEIHRWLCTIYLRREEAEKAWAHLQFGLEDSSVTSNL